MYANSCFGFCGVCLFVFKGCFERKEDICVSVMSNLQNSLKIPIDVTLEATVCVVTLHCSLCLTLVSTLK